MKWTSTMYKDYFQITLTNWDNQFKNVKGYELLDNTIFSSNFVIPTYYRASVNSKSTKEIEREFTNKFGLNARDLGYFTVQNGKEIINWNAVENDTVNSFKIKDVLFNEIATKAFNWLLRLGYTRENLLLLTQIQGKLDLLERKWQIPTMNLILNLIKLISESIVAGFESVGGVAITSNYSSSITFNQAVRVEEAKVYGSTIYAFLTESRLSVVRLTEIISSREYTDMEIKNWFYLSDNNEYDRLKLICQEILTDTIIDLNGLANDKLDNLNLEGFPTDSESLVKVVFDSTTQKWKVVPATASTSTGGTNNLGFYLTDTLTSVRLANVFVDSYIASANSQKTFNLNYVNNQSANIDYNLNSIADNTKITLILPVLNTNNTITRYYQEVLISTFPVGINKEKQMVKIGNLVDINQFDNWAILEVPQGVIKTDIIELNTRTPIERIRTSLFSDLKLINLKNIIPTMTTNDFQIEKEYASSINLLLPTTEKIEIDKDYFFDYVAQINQSDILPLPVNFNSVVNLSATYNFTFKVQSTMFNGLPSYTISIKLTNTPIVISGTIKVINTTTSVATTYNLDSTNIAQNDIYPLFYFETFEYLAEGANYTLQAQIDDLYLQLDNKVQSILTLYDATTLNPSSNIYVWDTEAKSSSPTDYPNNIQFTTQHQISNLTKQQILFQIPTNIANQYYGMSQPITIRYSADMSANGNLRSTNQDTMLNNYETQNKPSETELGFTSTKKVNNGSVPIGGNLYAQSVNLSYKGIQALYDGTYNSDTPTGVPAVSRSSKLLNHKGDFLLTAYEELLNANFQRPSLNLTSLLRSNLMDVGDVIAIKRTLYIVDSNPEDSIGNYVELEFKKVANSTVLPTTWNNPNKVNVAGISQYSLVVPNGSFKTAIATARIQNKATVMYLTVNCSFTNYPDSQPYIDNYSFDIPLQIPQMRSKDVNISINEYLEYAITSSHTIRIDIQGILELGSNSIRVLLKECEVRLSHPSLSTTRFATISSIQLNANILGVN